MDMLAGQRVHVYSEPWLWASDGGAPS